MLTPSERSRYSRHLLLPEIGEAGQLRLKQSSVLVVGAGGLGSPAATYLAAAGVGTIGLVDFDRVDATNLHRQILYGTSSVGRPKLEAARERLADLNDEIRITLHHTRLTSENALEILAPYDVVLDGTDNFATRYLVNDACVLLGKPNVYGSVYRFDGQVSVFSTSDGPCYRCLHEEPPPPNLAPSCAEGGVLGVLPGVIGTLQATEAIKLITGAGTTLAGRLLLFDALRAEFRTVKLRRRCGEHASIDRLIDYEEYCNPVNERDITPAQLAERLRSGELVVIDVRELHEWNAGHLPEAKHIPLSQVMNRLEEIPRDREVVMVCRSGSRSAHAQEHLITAAGYTRVKNLVGGMMRWSREIDPSMRVG